MLIFHQITKLFGGKCACIKKLDMKWIEIALEYCTFTLISSLDRKRSNIQCKLWNCPPTPYSQARWGGGRGGQAKILHWGGGLCTAMDTNTTHSRGCHEPPCRNFQYLLFVSWFSFLFFVFFFPDSLKIFSIFAFLYPSTFVLSHFANFVFVSFI